MSAFIFFFPQMWVRAAKTHSVSVPPQVASPVTRLMNISGKTSQAR